MSDGTKTSEAWLGLLPVVLGGVGKALTDPDPTVRVVALCCATVAACAYMWARTRLKTAPRA